MSLQGPTGSIWRALARSSAQPRRYRTAKEAQHSSSRHASTSRVTLGINKSSTRAGPSSSPRAHARANNSDASSSSSAPKQRRLLPPQPGRGLTNEFIDEAKRDMQLRKMPYDEADLQWLREARYNVYTLNGKQTKLQQEQKQITTELNQLFKADAKAAKKWARKLKGPVKDLGAADASEDAASDSNGAEAEKSTVKGKGVESERPIAKGKEDKDADADELQSKGKEDKDAEAEKSTVKGKERRDNEQERHVKELRERAKQIKHELDKVQKQQDEIRDRSHRIRLSWPNHCHPDVPVGPEENAVLVSVKDPLNVLPSEFDVMKESWNQSVIQIKHFPEGPQADSNRDHLAVASTASSAEVDMVSGSLATGSSWPYLLGSISLLEHALSQYAMSIVVRKGFTAVSPPDVVRADLADRCGFRPRDEKAKQTYFLEGAKSEGAQDVHQQKQQSSADLCLAATAEIPLAGLLASRTFESPRRPGKFFGDDSSLIQQSELPIKLAALGHAFRAEAGARGADTRGLYRVHQFSKIEMFVAMAGGLEQSNAMLEELRSTQEEIIGGLGLPYRVLDMPTEELGASAYRKYDIEVWMPGRGSWGEVSSASNCTSYQALRLGIKLKRSGPYGRSSPSPNDDAADPRHPTVHTLNATAAAIPRLIVAILENHGVEKGKLVLPDTLKPFWLAGDQDPNVTWLHTGKLSPGSQSRLQRALTQVRTIAKKNGTDAPTMVASFLILHELTAIVPLVIMFYVFGALGVGTAVLQWLLGDDTTDAKQQQGDDDSKSLSARFRAWARLKEERFERYCRKKGYLGFEKQTAEEIDQAGDLGKSNHLAGSFANMVAAYILVKALIPVRIGASVALAGPFSRTVLEPVKNLARRVAFLRPRPVGKAPASS